MYLNPGRLSSLRNCYQHNKTDYSEQMRANERALRGTQRDLAKDMRELDRQEKQLVRTYHLLTTYF